MDWIQFVTFFVGNLVVFITLWLWSRAESRADSRQLMDILISMKDEMKDFHGKLEKQDAEFKAFLMKKEG